MSLLPLPRRRALPARTRRSGDPGGAPPRRPGIGVSGSTRDGSPQPDRGGLLHPGDAPAAGRGVESPRARPRSGAGRGLAAPHRDLRRFGYRTCGDRGARRRARGRNPAGCGAR
ncbi:MAG: hypothetical protein E6K75_02705 [Candidatus Eisenbacteria bacterium]|uniref:Uncharacterized protein n=1 Tax=Eiseniibacteriota bacterium TaxID=2212470 RepID=A0A538TA84_UNCEI|nr:MAG: hypothetical protein E6K75_02705 [Candidatus Eisenbacteria bacterium]